MVKVTEAKLSGQDFDENQSMKKDIANFPYSQCPDFSNDESEYQRFKELYKGYGETERAMVSYGIPQKKPKVIYHGGPTNSGKTYNAVKRLCEAPSGIYCAPLRLLASEQWTTINSKGVLCNLETGQERHCKKDARHLSCTVEKADLNKFYDVAILDEIQMIGDADRGWAWTRALMRINATELHLCGDESAILLVRAILEQMGNTNFTIQKYQRKHELNVFAPPNGDFTSWIEKGDCLVVFSRNDIYDYKRHIESSTRFKCCIIYGALPPEVRRREAELFNTQDNGYDVLIATDSIGMGLNLNIRRIIFSTCGRGEYENKLKATEIKQIAGRAGRMGGRYYLEGGYVTCLEQCYLDYLKEMLSKPLEPLRHAKFLPDVDQLLEFVGDRLNPANYFVKEALANFPCPCPEGSEPDSVFQSGLFSWSDRWSDMYYTAHELESGDEEQLLKNWPPETWQKLFRDTFVFASAPISRHQQMRDLCQIYYFTYIQKVSRELKLEMSYLKMLQGRQRETFYSDLELYIWFARHFPETFPDLLEAQQISQDVSRLLSERLRLTPDKCYDENESFKYSSFLRRRHPRRVWSKELE